VDPLSHVLSLLNVTGFVSAPLHAGGSWAVAFEGRMHVRFEAVVEGGCWLSVEGAGEPLRLEQGDCYLLVGSRRFRLAGDPDTAAVPAFPLYRTSDGVPRGLARVGGGHDTTLVGGGFTFDADTAPLLLDVLPPVIHIPGSSDQAVAVRAALDLLAHEMSGARLGAAPMLDRLAQVVLLHAVRAYAATVATRPQGTGWLVASLDPQIGGPIRAMHGDIAHPWSVRELATLAGMSRSAFAPRFKRLVGATPLEYLLRLRLHSASRMLRDTDRTVASIAGATGYGSEGAFSTAFKRGMGVSPGEYRLRAASRSCGSTLAS
jgi:AraC-like DNA-binding protein